VFRRTLRPDASDRSLVRATRIGILATAALAMALALAFDRSIKSIWKTVGSLTTSAVLVPTALGLAGWRPRGAGFASMVAGIVGTIGWAAARQWGGPWALRLEALVPGLVCSLTAYAIAGLRGRR